MTFGLAQIKPEGYMVFYDYPEKLPFLSRDAKGAVYRDKIYSKREYALLVVKNQSYF